MTELITRSQADTIFGVALPILGIVAAGIVFARRQDRGLAVRIGGPLVLAGVLWWIYNAITDKLGLDTVANLIVNLLLFLLVGAAIGMFWPKSVPTVDPSQPPRQSEGEDEGDAGEPGPVGVGPAAPAGAAVRRIEEATAPPRNP